MAAIEFGSREAVEILYKDRIKDGVGCAECNAKMARDTCESCSGNGYVEDEFLALIGEDDDCEECEDCWGLGIAMYCTECDYWESTALHNMRSKRAVALYSEVRASDTWTTKWAAIDARLVKHD